MVLKCKYKAKKWLNKDFLKFSGSDKEYNFTDNSGGSFLPHISTGSMGLIFVETYPKFSAFKNAAQKSPN
jgi:hypothetical protein